MYNVCFTKQFDRVWESALAAMTGLLLLVVMAGSALARHTRQTSPPLVDTQPRHLHLALGSQPASLVLSWSTVNREAPLHCAAPQLLSCFAGRN